MRKGNDEIYQLAKDQALVKQLKKNRPFCLCPPDVMFVSHGYKSSLFFVFDSLSAWIVVIDINLDLPESSNECPRDTSLDSRARASFS